jgi:pimeloyl-ACP methyl ester carboxylesterase
MTESPIVHRSVVESGLVRHTDQSQEGSAMPRPTVVLVHGAFADASSFGDVIPMLQDAGVDVVAPAVPNRSLNEDAAYVGAILESIDGPIVLAGHSYGAAVVSVAGGADHVHSLVFLAGFVPDKGESLGELAGRFPESDLARALVPVPVPGGADLTVDVDEFHAVFAGDVDPVRARTLAASQRPLASAAFGAPADDAAWRSKPSWGIVATADRTINPDVQRFGLRRAGAAVTEVESSHLVMLSHPVAVVDLIDKALRAAAT